MRMSLPKLRSCRPGLVPTEGPAKDATGIQYERSAAHPAPRKSAIIVESTRFTDECRDNSNVCDVVVT